MPRGLEDLGVNWESGEVEMPMLTLFVFPSGTELPQPAVFMDGELNKCGSSGQIPSA